MDEGYILAAAKSNPRITWTSSFLPLSSLSFSMSHYLCDLELLQQGLVKRLIVGLDVMVVLI